MSKEIDNLFIERCDISERIQQAWSTEVPHGIIKRCCLGYYVYDYFDRTNPEKEETEKVKKEFISELGCLRKHIDNEIERLKGDK